MRRIKTKIKINIFSENIHPNLEVDEKKAINAAKKILKFYLNEENIFNRSCLSDKDFNCISFDILYCDNEKTHQLNKEYRKKNYPADIITFAVFADGEEKFILDGEINLGEIIISLDKVMEKGKGKREKGKEEEIENKEWKIAGGHDANSELSLRGDSIAADEAIQNPSLPTLNYNPPFPFSLFPFPFEDELNFLISHGIMHLLGFDHQTNEDYNFIVSAQNDALKSLEVQHGKL